MYCQCDLTPKRPEFAMIQVAPLLAPHIFWCSFCGRLKNSNGWQVPKVTYDPEHWGGKEDEKMLETNKFQEPFYDGQEVLISNLGPVYPSPLVYGIVLRRMKSGAIECIIPSGRVGKAIVRCRPINLRNFSNEDNPLTKNTPKPDREEKM